MTVTSAAVREPSVAETTAQSCLTISAEQRAQFDTHRSRIPKLTGTGDAQATRASVRDYFIRTYETYESLFTLLATESAFYQRPERLRHPLIFYFGHTATFFINKLVAAKATTRVDAQFEGLFAIGVDEMSWDDLDESHYDWPSVSRVREYRDQVRNRVVDVIDHLDWTSPIRPDQHPQWAVLMGIEHERIHLETSSVLIRQLPIENVKPQPAWPACQLMRRDRNDAPRNHLIKIPGATINLGKPLDHSLYGWDNEYGTAVAKVADFKAASMLVSNAEFAEFVEAGGYRTERYWSEEGWRWAQYRQASHPTFWVVADGQYRYRSLAAITDMPWDWPVDVNFHEAKAFAEWKAETTGRSIRLPTEAEYRRLRQYAKVPDQPDWGEVVPANVNLEHFASSTPVDHFAHGAFFDVIGNVWQWTETPIDALPGFRPHPLYDDFSVPTFDRQHNLIHGGSWISTGNEATEHARYAFRRHFFQHAGFRYVEATPLRETTATDTHYESDALVSQYCEFHYGRGAFGVANFPQAIAEAVLQQLDGRPRGVALDLGCAVGRLSFELAPHFGRVVGLDYSARFVQVAQKLLEGETVRYRVPTEGELHEDREIDLDRLGLERRNNVEFWQQDACNLKPQFTGFDLVCAINLIDRLYDPARFLTDIATRIKPGGLLALASPYTWQEESTPREAWIGGRQDENGRPITTFDALRNMMAGSFELVGEPMDIPFVIRETARKHQHTLSQLTFWRRR
ncbi:MAG: 5-histidylcysteine sulfoxide synthase [Thioalkalivibrionaceae bacterium]